MVKSKIKMNTKPLPIKTIDYLSVLDFIKLHDSFVNQKLVEGLSQRTLQDYKRNEHIKNRDSAVMTLVSWKITHQPFSFATSQKGRAPPLRIYFRLFKTFFILSAKIKFLLKYSKVSTLEVLFIRIFTRVLSGIVYQRL